MRRFALLAGLLLLAAGTAQAQVAVPDLLPAAPRYVFFDAQGFNGATITPDNPAALQWQTASRVALGIVQHEAVAGGSVGYDGNYLGGAWVFESWAAGIEHLSVERDDGTESETASSVQLSYRLFDSLALGAGVDRAGTESGGSVVDAESRTLGFSLVLNEMFYLAYGAGMDDYENNLAQTASRDSSMWGLAFRAEGDWRWYLAWDQVYRESDFAVPWGGVDAQTLTGQVGIGDWVFGLQRIAIDQPGGTVEINTSLLDIGWVPEQGGLTVSARISEGEVLIGGVPFQDTKGRSLTVGYLF